jgi:hypothetical protein
VPSGDFSRYFMSQIWRAISLMESFRSSQSWHEGR